jgi:hypothetical protein
MAKPSTLYVDLGKGVSKEREAERRREVCECVRTEAYTAVENAMAFGEGGDLI